MALESWIEEFCFRGRPSEGPGSEMPSTYQVIIGKQAPSMINAGTFERVFEGPLTPEQAEGLGLDLASLVAGINSAAISESIAKSQQIEELQEEILRLNQELSDLRAV